MNDLEMKQLLEFAPKPYIPPKLPLDTFSFVNPEILQLMSKANNAIGQYTGFLMSTPNPWLLMSPITTQEAVLSSKLEGTHATLEDILNHEAGNQTHVKEDEINEILNYRQALVYAMENMSPIDKLSKTNSKFPLTVKLLKKMHEILLSNVRGSTKHPGEFKISQNYIGGAANISFTPLPPNLTDEYMSNLERYINYEDINTLLQAAIIHAQFEMIHPFEDGNGRIGRLLIPLFFYYTGLIPLPTFYMSSFFEKNRDIYIQKLANISDKNDWIGWFSYFLKGIDIQSKLNTEKAIKILKLYETFKNKMNEVKSYHFIQILDFTFQHPIFTVKQILEDKNVNIGKQTLYNTLKKMIDTDVLTTSRKSRNNTYICNELLSIIDVN